ncbi:hypothetical protein Dshi_3558 [Dinoroseobacter shibae DFL 12 = DSM 16493]|jgi:hypothetical protein|uniref:Uncharacterized protein n=1 Tax=Dinoroseobacter shibae (strain DSM 16493 / NCIMB 14021 / DFL 12) TaxID=398580 RepID=A8LQ51_DINSH|nr:hypothetical protein [Dinoroseobacter shibae]ABV95291.1 hypothetical protein Dshi_3558 [Dinoroseobacter shibae DFL 12 = DSM 16493]URF46697.1 hypothetical protein M8008_18270 [Dinoroseobacter shibae]URF51008.1 hypothetical protein M8007_18295 [Dinoroseobacter shibae]
MFLELIATFAIGFLAAGLVLLANLLTGRRLSRAFVPLAAGAAMIGFTIWSEYSWYPRTKAQLPEGVLIVSTNESQALYRPWTYAAPFVDKFAAVDLARVLRNEKLPDQILVPMLFMGRWAPGAEIPVVVDCGGSRRAKLADDTEFDDKGAVLNADWVSVEADDPLLEAVCT